MELESMPSPKKNSGWLPIWFRPSYKTLVKAVNATTFSGEDLATNNTPIRRIHGTGWIFTYMENHKDKSTPNI